MTQWIQQLLWHSLAMSATVLAYHIVVVRLHRRYAAKWLYLVGIILLVGFLIPFRPTVTVAMNQVPRFIQPAITEEPTGQPSAHIAQQTAQETVRYHPWHIAFTVWAFGALVVLIYHGIKHLRFVSTVKRWCVDVQDVQLLAQFEDAKRSLTLEGCDIGFARCSCVHSPMLLQLGKPTVILPDDEQAAYDLHFILLHELVHYKRKDLLCRLAMLLSIAIHWFNPAIYLLVKHVTMQCEISCDERVVRDQDLENRHQYAMSIISVARCHAKGYTLLTTYFNGGKDTMKKRINSVYEPAKTKMGVLLLACTLLVTILAGTSIAADAEELQYTLPETPVKLDERVSKYVVSWEPMDGIKEYHLGVYFSFQIEETTLKDKDGGESEPLTQIWKVGGGWVGPNTVTDGAGTEYQVAEGLWESVVLPGDVSEVDLRDLINRQLEPIQTNDDPVTYAKKEALLSCTMLMTVVRESGEPFVVEINIPVA